MKVPFEEVAALIADRLTTAMGNEELEEFFYDAQYHYFSLDADEDEVLYMARELGVLDEDDEIGYPENEM